MQRPRLTAEDAKALAIYVRETNKRDPEAVEQWADHYWATGKDGEPVG